MNKFLYPLNPIGHIDFLGLKSCPQAAPKQDPDWKSYYGNPHVFHCGFDTYLENITPSPGNPMGECVYDHSGKLVDDSHPFSGCKGTPNEYGKENPIKHTFIDDGGIVKNGIPAAYDSARYKLHEASNAVGRFFYSMEREILSLYGLGYLRP